MKYIDEYREDRTIRKLIHKISEGLKHYNNEIVLMEICGTHTMSIFRSGLQRLFPAEISLLSGPGCPVCVTPNAYLDKAIAYSKLQDTIIVTFGDIFRVPGSSSSLEKENAKDSDIRIVYSPLDAVKTAEKNPDKNIIFLAVGFETTAPLIALSIRIAKRRNLKNYSVFCGHKLIPPAIKGLIQDKEINIDGFILPGHVSTIIGTQPYQFISNDHHIPSVVTGFEPLDIVQGVYILISQIVNHETPKVQIQYTRSVKEKGNSKALDLIKEVFQATNAQWRGLQSIHKSGLKIRKTYRQFDAEEKIEVEVEETKENNNCICGDILRGIKNPLNCKLFRTICSPENPIGACMVSSEGTCAAYYKYADIGRDDE
ncbi:MAG: hydrogenase formation protein HypD [Deltaproteobacteria bacterium]|nr:MAG: hydrogenase formation protein HypD [Deltaproteobacteria bacterium]